MQKTNNIQLNKEENCEFAQLEYPDLVEKFASISEESQFYDIENKCIASFKKLRITRKFSKIDDEILTTTLKNHDNSQGFFSKLISLETMRLRFKEEASKCRTQTRSKLQIKT